MMITKVSSAPDKDDVKFPQRTELYHSLYF